MIEGLVICPENALLACGVNVICAALSPTFVVVSVPANNPNTPGGAVPFNFIVNDEPFC